MLCEDFCQTDANVVGCVGRNIRQDDHICEGGVRNTKEQKKIDLNLQISREK